MILFLMIWVIADKPAHDARTSHHKAGSLCGGVVGGDRIKLPAYAVNGGTRSLKPIKMNRNRWI